jgi:hypothetical protein
MRFEIKYFSSTSKNSPANYNAAVVVANSKVVGLAPGAYDRELQRQSCKNLQRLEYIVRFEIRIFYS